jgi:hypothetical protein
VPARIYREATAVRRKVNSMSSGVQRRFLATVAVAVCALALTACTKSTPNSNPAPTGSTGASPTATTGGQAGGGAPGGGSGGSGGGSGTAITFPTDAGAYTKAALAAYVAKDVATLDQYEDTGGQLHTMLGCNGCYNTAFTYHNCEGAAGSSYCLFINAVGDELRLRVNNAALGQPRAMGGGSIFNPIAFPSDDQAYAQEALDAWQSGDDPRLKLLTSAPFTSAQITAKGPDVTGSWTFDRGDGAAGSIYYDFKDGAGHQLAFRFTNGPAAPSTGPASQHRITDVVYQP